MAQQTISRTPTRSRSRNTQAAPAPLEDRIRFRAYQIYESRAREDVPGDPVTDWLRAEQEIGAREKRSR